ncbi:MAG: penicillin-binding protein activator [Novosphingobium sp.]|uniref:penicillin-binding protein activator n=1 Tax=Novosphingobium sp. TaxID=1874826 RepID=UPI0032BE4DDA
MIEWKANRRTLITAGALALLAGCKVIPKGVEEVPPPAPAPTDNLPNDKQRQRIALLVPLSGPDAALGQSIANATTMALLDTNAQTIRITSYDTAPGAASAAAKALRDGNRLILGPISSADIGAVAAAARGRKVPLITYSSDPALATRDVFVMGLDPANAMQRVVDFASSKGMRRFALLAPKGTAGARASAIYAAAVQAAGGTLVSTQTYDRGNRSIISAATRLKARGGYDAVLIADSPKYAAMAAPSLKPAGAAVPRILGSETWSGDPLVGKTASLRGAWFAAISDTRFPRFAESFRGRFGTAPYRLSTLGYDSVLLTVRIARDWRLGSPFPLARLTERDGFLGLDGPFRFGSAGIGDRALEVREARSGGVTIVSPAPEKFAD